MAKQTIFSNKQHELLDFLIEKARNPTADIPPIPKISENLGISSASLREQMELAKNLGFISAQPRKGIKILPYEFKPAVIKSLYYAIRLDLDFFYQFSDLRNHLEKSYFLESIKILDDKDFYKLDQLIDRAFEKLNGLPVQIPHAEHKEFHLTIYQPINNKFLIGILESYWDIYEQVGLNLYNNLDYLKNVWDYHQKIVDKIKLKDFDDAYKLLVSHMELLDKR